MTTTPMATAAHSSTREKSLASQGSDPLATAAFGNAVCRSSEETMPLDNSAKSGLAGVGADCANALAPEPSAKARPRASHTGGKIKTLARSPLARVAILSVRRFTMPYPVCGDVTKPPSLRRRRRFQRASGQTRNHSAHAGGNQATDFPYFTDEPLAASLRPSMRELFPTGQSAACAENASPSLRGSEATKQSRLSPNSLVWIASSLRSLAMTAALSAPRGATTSPCDFYGLRCLGTRPQAPASLTRGNAPPPIHSAYSSIGRGRPIR